MNFRLILVSIVVSSAFVVALDSVHVAIMEILKDNPSVFVIKERLKDVNMTGSIDARGTGFRGLQERGFSSNSITILSAAAGSGNREVVRMLLEDFGANIDATDTEGYTPLMNAALRGQESVVTMLLEYGANPSLETKPFAMIDPMSGMEETFKFNAAQLAGRGLGKTFAAGITRQSSEPIAWRISEMITKTIKPTKAGLRGSKFKSTDPLLLHQQLIVLSQDLGALSDTITRP